MKSTKSKIDKMFIIYFLALRIDTDSSWKRRVEGRAYGQVVAELSAYLKVQLNNNNNNEVDSNSSDIHSWKW